MTDIGWPIRLRKTPARQGSYMHDLGLWMQTGVASSRSIMPALGIVVKDPFIPSIAEGE